VFIYSFKFLLKFFFVFLKAFYVLLFGNKTPERWLLAAALGAADTMMTMMIMNSVFRLTTHTFLLFSVLAIT